jgi:hypothetical protein
MSVAAAIPSSLGLASGNPNDYIAPAIPAGAPLPPNAVLEAGREYATRKHIRLHEPDANGVTHNELNNSKRRKARVETASFGGNLHAIIAANHATAQANHATAQANHATAQANHATILALLVPLAASVAKNANANNNTVRLLVSELEQQVLY